MTETYFLFRNMYLFILKKYYSGYCSELNIPSIQRRVKVVLYLKKKKKKRPHKGFFLISCLGQSHLHHVIVNLAYLSEIVKSAPFKGMFIFKSQITKEGENQNWQNKTNIV